MRSLIVTTKDNAVSLSYSQHLIEEIQQDNKYAFVDIQTEKDFQEGDNLLFCYSFKETNTISKVLWYKIQLPLWIKKYKIEQLIFLDGYCPKNIKQHKTLVIPDTSYLYNKTNNKNWQQFSRKNIIQSLNTADKVISYSSSAIQLLEQQPNVQIKSAIPLLPISKNSIAIEDWETRENLKDELSEGHEFLLATVDDDVDNSIIHLLKSYSIFKKWQKSNMRLIILVPPYYLDSLSLKDKIETYRFRDSVSYVTTDQAELITKIYQAAFTLIHLSETDGNITPIVRAIQTNVPIIRYKTPSSDNLLGEASFVLQDKSEDELGKLLNNIYKIEALTEQIKTNLSLIYQEKIQPIMESGSIVGQIL